ncbi:MAG: trigger factor [bacterium]
MKVEVEEVSPVVKRLDIEIPPEQVDDEIEEQYKEVQSKAQVPGFRPGKVPRKIIERRFKKHIHELALEELVKQSLEPALSRKNIIPLVEPVLDPAELVPGEAYKYSVHVEVKPEIEPVDYKGVEVTHQDEEVSDDDVDRALASLQESAATIKEPDEDRPVRDNDLVTVTMTATEDTGAELASGEEEEIALGREHWIPGLTDKLKGRSRGELLQFSMEMPEEDTIPENYQGKTVGFEISIDTVKEKILPELTDEFASEYTKHESLSELRESIRERLHERTTQLNLDRMQGEVLDKILENNPIEVPPTPVKEEAKQQARNFFKQNLQREITDDELESVIDMFKPEAEKSFRINFLLEAIADKEGIEASEEDVENRIAERARMSGIHPDKLKDRLDEQTRETMKRQARLENTLDFLVREANISGKESRKKPESETVAENEEK